MARKWVLYLLAFGSLAATHLLFLRLAPAFHLDEAWAALFSHRIATEPGFWPIQAMSPYTSAWSHYVTAAIFKVFGTDLWNFRATGIAEVLAGVALISVALEVLGERLAAALFPLVVAFFPALVMNHRWVIEQDTFYVLCAGMVFLGFALRYRRGHSRLAAALIVSGTALGIGSHVLFLGLALSVWLFLLLKGKLGRLPDRMIVASIAALILPFFILIFKTDTEPGRALALIALDLVILAISLAPPLVGWISERARKGLLITLAVCGLPLLIPLAVYGEGSWLALFFTGQMRTPYLIGTIFIPLVLTWVWLPRSARPGLKALLELEPLCLIPISLLIIQAMIVKPGPRYLEIPYLFCAVFLALALARITPRRRLIVMGLWIVLGGALLSVGYFKPALEQSQAARSYRFLIFHDASFDMLPKLKLVDRLAALGCGYEDLQVSDDRIRQTLRFLSYGDWPRITPGGCKLARPVRVNSASWSAPWMVKGLTAAPIGGVVAR